MSKILKLTCLIVATLIGTAWADDEEFHYVHCCEYKELVDHTIGGACPQVSSSGGKKEQFKAQACQINCIAREMNLTEGDSFDITKYNQLVDRLVSDDAEAQQFYKTKGQECDAKMIEIGKHHQHKDDDPQCSKKVFGTMLCLGHKVALDCPEGKQIKTAECDTQRDHFKKMQQHFEKMHGQH